MSEPRIRELRGDLAMDAILLVIISPFYIIGKICIGAWLGLRDADRHIRAAWSKLRNE